jgi:phosphoribosyl-AMP cyclohydrolase / phosphoribosyl-ATP pyrophosphohydrolase
MLIPSIDIVAGRAVQLVGGEEQRIDGGDPFAWLERFSRCGEVAVVDIDAARGEGDNTALISEMCRLADIRVGGGIRDLATARGWLDLGAARVVIGTAADPDLLSALPRDHVIAAIDSRDSSVLSHGWRQDTGGTLLDRVAALAPHCGGILVTFVELEGRLGGTDVERARSVVGTAPDTRITVAGGITTAQEIATLDELGADAQVGMALYSGELALSAALTAPMTSDRPDGLWPTVVVDEAGATLGLVYSNLDSVTATLESGAGTYHSRKRGLWEKGATSGAGQEVVKIDLDCDRDTLRFTVRQSAPGFCHTGSMSCWGEDHGLNRLGRRLASLAADPPEASNTTRLLEDPDLLAAKLTEEAGELARASSAEDVVHEAADLIYFTLVKTASAGVSVSQIETELDMRERRVTRRPMERQDR